MTPDAFGSDQAASLRERTGLTLPAGAVPAGTAPVVAVTVWPPHPSNAVVLLTRQSGGPAQVTRAVPESTAVPGEQWFRVTLPAVENGRRFDYRAELVRSGQRLATLPADGSWLTVIGDPGPVPPRASARPWTPPSDAAAPVGVPRFAFEPRFFATFAAGGRLEVIGETPDGYRVNFLIEGGSVTGRGLEAVVRPGGGDWMCVRPDGVASLEIRATAETANGAVIFYKAGGVLDLGPDGYAQIAAGRLSGCPPFYATPIFVTADPQWRWLNRVQGFGVGRVMMEERRVEYDVYLPHVGDRLPGG